MITGEKDVYLVSRAQKCVSLYSPVFARAYFLNLCVLVIRCDASSPYIHPVGYCEEAELTLTTPAGKQSMYTPVHFIKSTCTAGGSRAMQK